MLLRLSLNTKMGKHRIISPFFAQRAKKASAKGQSPPQELEVGPRSKPYLLVQVQIRLIITYGCVSRGCPSCGKVSRGGPVTNGATCLVYMYIVQLNW